MDTKKKNRELVSALADGALPADDLELAGLALRTDDGAAAWAVYHQIGDMLRAQASPDLSAGFTERLAARLAAEPLHPRRAAGTESAVDAPAVLAVSSRTS